MEFCRNKIEYLFVPSEKPPVKIVVSKKNKACVR